MRTDAATKGDMDIEMRAAVAGEVFTRFHLSEYKGVAFFPNGNGTDALPRFFREQAMAEHLKRKMETKQAPVSGD